jgi:hypothetical protein
VQRFITLPAGNEVPVDDQGGVHSSIFRKTDWDDKMYSLANGSYIRKILILTNTPCPRAAIESEREDCNILFNFNILRQFSNSNIFICLRVLKIIISIQPWLRSPYCSL